MRDKDVEQAIGWAVALIVLFAACCVLASCKATTKVEYRDREVRVVDTMREIVHDTTKTTIVVHDSVDRVVRDSAWVDSLGNRYHDHYERLFVGNNELQNELRASQSDYSHLLSQYNQLKEEKQKETIKTERVYIWKPFLAIFIVLSIVVLCRKQILKLLKKLTLKT